MNRIVIDHDRLEIDGEFVAQLTLHQQDALRSYRQDVIYKLQDTIQNLENLKT